MKLQRLNPHRRLYRCDICGAADNLRECFLGYSAAARTGDPGRGKFLDLCSGCQERVEADPRPYAPAGNLVVQARQPLAAGRK